MIPFRLNQAMLKWTPKRIVGGLAVLGGASLFAYAEPLFMHESSAYAGGFLLALLFGILVSGIGAYFLIRG
jgi:hypothetical protein